jgi:DNA-binding GntR family transcriptional regulator
MATLKNRTLSAAIAEQLRHDILSGVHPAGAQLRQDMLAAIFGVSRIPVREALFQLEAEGLVQIEPHKGAVVAGLSADEVDDVFELRLLLEPRLLRSSGPRLTPEDFLALDAIQTRFIDAVSAADTAQWGQLNAGLHMALYARATQPRTLAIVSGLLQTSDRYTRLQLSRTSAWARAEREHAELIRLCRTGAITKASDLLTTHIAAVHGDLKAVLARSPGALSAG